MIRAYNCDWCEDEACECVPVLISRCKFLESRNTHLQREHEEAVRALRATMDELRVVMAERDALRGTRGRN